MDAKLHYVQKLYLTFQVKIRQNWTSKNLLLFFNAICEYTVWRSVGVMWRKTFIFNYRNVIDIRHYTRSIEYDGFGEKPYESNTVNSNALNKSTQSTHTKFLSTTFLSISYKYVRRQAREGTKRTLHAFSETESNIRFKNEKIAKFTMLRLTRKSQFIDFTKNSKRLLMVENPLRNVSFYLYWNIAIPRFFQNRLNFLAKFYQP